MKISIIYKNRLFRYLRKIFRQLRIKLVLLRTRLFPKHMMRRAMRSKGILVYKSKFRAILKGKRLTRQYRIVYWVIPEELGHYVLNLESVHRLNANLKKKKTKWDKVRSKDLDQWCVWRSPWYNTL